MSGGHWQYVGGQIRDNLAMIAEDPDVNHRFPFLARQIGALAEVLYQIEHDLDWDLSYDTGIPDDAAWGARAVHMIRRAADGETTP